MIYFTADLHLGHANIIRSCGRPFESLEQMDETLIANWNERVGQDDTVYLLGDVVWNKKLVGDYISRLSGHKILIRGNHDDWWAGKPALAALFDEVHRMAELRMDGHPITLCHYPLLEWKFSRQSDEEHRGYLIYGHIHNNVRPLYRPLFEADNALNAGVDVNGFRPVTFDELIENNRAFRERALAALSE